MKYQRNIRTTWLFLRAVITVVVAVVIATLFPKRPRNDAPNRVTLFGHKLNGNHLALLRWARVNSDNLDCRYLTIDDEYYRTLRPTVENVLSAQRLKDMLWVVRGDAFITDHGPSIYKVLKILRPKLRFIDVWHGVGFKGYDSQVMGANFGRYDAIFAASQWNAQNQFVDQGIAANRVKVTGYALADELLAGRPPIEETSARYDLPAVNRPIVLFAPTWSHGASGDRARDTELETTNVLLALNELAAEADVTIVVRSHLNAREVSDGELSSLVFRPMQQYPDTVGLLRATDVLISDWSSIVTDFLVLNRPTIFLDTPDPFRDNHLLTPDDRVGTLVATINGLQAALEDAVSDPQAFMARYTVQRQQTLERAFGTTLDGKSCQRYADEIAALVDQAKTQK